MAIGYQTDAIKQSFRASTVYSCFDSVNILDVRTLSKPYDGLFVHVLDCDMIVVSIALQWWALGLQYI